MANPKYVNYIYTTNATIAIVNKSFQPEQPVKTTLIKVEDAYQSFSKLLEYYNQIKLMKSGIEQPSVVSEGVEYGSDLYLGSFSYIGKNVKIGNNVKIYPNCFIGDNVEIGDDCVFLQAFVFIQKQVLVHALLFIQVLSLVLTGLALHHKRTEVIKKVPQIGNVIIEDDVEIGSCSTVDRATLGSTIIRKGVKLDNQIQVAHNVEIGAHTVIAAQTAIAGSTKVEEIA